ncbi:MAG: DUF6265 family protein [Bacteroidales bacterium]|jgi:predicted enzyme related to lactoylglutathione lyase|nr:DUF6265 family protein [Bacteroidales bacterium]
MKKKVLSTSIVAFMAIHSAAQTLPVFLQGTWKMENESVFEHWDILSEHAMQGISYMMNSGIVVIEYLNIRIADGRTAYTATVPGHNDGKPVDFERTADDAFWIFENPRHDFPQKIVYQKLSDTELFVQLLGGDREMSYKLFRYSENQSIEGETKKVTGIGGVFFKCKDPAKMRAWYQIHLGLKTNDYGAVFEWRQGADASKKGFTQWSPFSQKTDYFDPSGKDFMINYRVENMETLVEELKRNGVTVLDDIETYEYGKFVHIIDLEGNKIELWEPDDIEYEKLGKQLKSETIK